MTYWHCNHEIENLQQQWHIHMQRYSVAVLDATCQIEMNCAFPGLSNVLLLLLINPFSWVTPDLAGPQK